MANLRFHFKNILWKGLDPFREPLQVQFSGESSREVAPFSVKYIDGFTKGLIAQSIAAIVDKLDPCHASLFQK